MDDATARLDAQPTASNHFAWLNTQMALQRTLMAGVRTSVSLIGFGFTVAQFFERMQDRGPLAKQFAPQAPAQSRPDPDRRGRAPGRPVPVAVPADRAPICGPSPSRCSR